MNEDIGHGLGCLLMALAVAAILLAAKFAGCT